MIGTRQLWMSGAILLAGASCGQSDVESIEGLRGRCVAQIVAKTLGGDAMGTMPANFSGPLGLTPSSDPDAPPYVSKQLQMVGPDRNMRFFIVDSAQWTRAALFRMTPTGGEPNHFIAVIDRRGAIVAIGRIENRRLSMSALNDTQAMREALIERSLWIASMPSQACSDLTRRERIAGLISLI